MPLAKSRLDELWPLISVTGAQLEWAVREPPLANRMLVTKALPQDVAFLAFVPLSLLRGLPCPFLPQDMKGYGSMYFAREKCAAFYEDSSTFHSNQL
ncbi:hypothetical protein GCM10008967_26010 [Bacillus carboniphilus]|uniref:Uncharacterized protein n=1 Tax=Bacillus carboniphilus TaxID=86663 RepID=A0ABN0WDV0_9BACI